MGSGNSGSGSMKKSILRIGHSPDPDDAFMWFPITGIAGGEPLIDTGRFRYTGVQQDIESLNLLSERSGGSDLLEITAVSMAQYPYIADRYVFTSCGASMGEGYGPKVVTRSDVFERVFPGFDDSSINVMNGVAIEDLRRWLAGKHEGIDGGGGKKVRLAIPGERTSAYLGFRLMIGDQAILDNNIEVIAVAFDEIMERVCDGEFDVGLVIHEGQLTFEKSYGLRLLADLGVWWTGTYDLPLPLGANVIRRDLDEVYGVGTLGEVTAVLKASLNFALTHRDMAIEYALRFGRGLDKDLADEFVAMYVNKYTTDFGERGRAGVREFLGQAGRAGFCPVVKEFDFVEPAT